MSKRLRQRSPKAKVTLGQWLVDHIDIAFGIATFILFLAVLAFILMTYMRMH